MILYDNPVSSNALKVRFLLGELALPYERREVPLTEPRPAWYLALNPMGRVPTIDDDGFVLTESNTILRHLALREGRDDLYPAAPPDRMRVDEFLDRWSSAFRPAFLRVERPAFGMHGHPVDPEAARRLAGDLAPTLALLDAMVAGETVLGRFTIVDAAIAPILFRTSLTPIDLAPHPRLARLRDALTSRPAFLAADPVR